jgi:dihydrofolate reductase
VTGETEIRKVVLYQLLSLDGVAEEPSDWMSDGGRELFENLGAVVGTQDDILLGRGTYDYWVGYWPASDVEPFATFVNTTRKHVFSSTPLTREWANTVVADRPPVEYVTDLRRGEGGDIGIHGSIELARSLLSADLVDELRLVVAPALAHTGRRLFDGTDDRGVRALELLDSTRTEAGSLLLAYRVAVS